MSDPHNNSAGAAINTVGIEAHTKDTTLQGDECGEQDSPQEASHIHNHSFWNICA